MLCEFGISGVFFIGKSGKRTSRPDYACAQSFYGIRFSPTKSLDTVDYMDEQLRNCSRCADARAHLGLYCSHIPSLFNDTQQTFNDSNTDVSFTVADSNSFLSLQEILPRAQENK